MTATSLEIHDPELAERLLADANLLGVRPPDQPVPLHLRQGPLATTFARWIRMRDDGGHAPAKAAIILALDRLDDATIQTAAEKQSRLAFSGGWDHWLWAISISSMADLLGLGPRTVEEQQTLAARFHAIARGLAPTATTVEVAAADLACSAVMAQLEASPALPLRLPDPRDEHSNRCALLWQSFDAGAALLGQAALALSQDPTLRRPGTVSVWLPRIVNQRGVVLNTRRFAPNNLTISGQNVRRGEAIIIWLRALAFGHGPHQCPGQRIAMTIATTALETFLQEPDIVWPTEWQVLALPNASIPIFKENPR